MGFVDNNVKLGDFFPLYFGFVPCISFYEYFFPIFDSSYTSGI